MHSGVDVRDVSALIYLIGPHQIAEVRMGRACQTQDGGEKAAGQDC